MLRSFTLILTVGSLVLAGCSKASPSGASAPWVSSSAARPTSSKSGPKAPASPLSKAPAPPVDPIAYTGHLPKATGHATLRVSGEARRVFAQVPATRVSRPPLLVVLHGTGANQDDGALDFALTELGAREVAEGAGAILVAPFSSAEGGVNADHEYGGPGWRFGNPASNPDLALVRAVIQDAVGTYSVDPVRVYLVGFSNGAFFAYYAAMNLADRVAAFAESSGGMIACGNRVDCGHKAAGADSCAKVLAKAPPACTCAVGEGAFPARKPAGRVPAAYLKHNADDGIVSAVFTCRLAEHLGGRALVRIDPTGDHGPTNEFMAKAWEFLAARTLGD